MSKQKDKIREKIKNLEEALKGAIEEIGIIDDVTENINTGTVVDGHMRITLAMREGDHTVLPYKLVNLTPEEEDYALVLCKTGWIYVAL